MYDFNEYIELSAALAKERKRSEELEFKVKLLNKALNQSIKLLESAMYIRPENSMLYKHKIKLLKEILEQNE